ncbi:MAG: hypothetical protein N3C63_06505 [Rhodocyclaceae bacterium]|nr:hypothetical protein [Rhodocyclaceae bacterium]
MPRFYLVVGLLALALYAWGQSKGVGLFDETVQSAPQRGTSRPVFHK